MTVVREPASIRQPSVLHPLYHESLQNHIMGRNPSILAVSLVEDSHLMDRICAGLEFYGQRVLNTFSKALKSAVGNMAVAIKGLLAIYL